MTRRVRRWHRVAGLSLALLWCYLAITGVLLRHAGEWSNQHVEWPWLHHWYGLADNSRTFAVAGQWVHGGHGQLWLNRTPLPPLDGTLLGAVGAGELLWVVTNDGAMLVTAEGDMVERIDRSLGFPHGCQALAQGLLAVACGERIWQWDEENLSFTPGQIEVSWQQLVTKPTSLADLGGTELRWLTVIRDLHSGVLWGLPGSVLSDLAAIGLLLMAASGWWLSRRR